ncbi:MAG: RNA methyltransferase [Clostridia bacterium]|nr:RNA methyltransferase [Clostridia bacterium]
MIITSKSNELIKRARALRRAKERRESGLHLIEGDKLVLDALRSKAAIKTVFVEAGFDAPAGAPCVFVSREVLESLCETEAPQHLCAVAATPDCSCPKLYPDGLVVVLDGLQDPGNVGTIIRTADALGARAVLLGEDAADAFSPKCVRSAMGSCYHIPVFRSGLLSELERLERQGFLLLCGHLQGTETPPPKAEKTALVIGNEGRGVKEELASLCYRYRLPQKGGAESLNAAVFAAIMMDRILNSY